MSHVQMSVGNHVDTQFSCIAIFPIPAFSVFNLLLDTCTLNSFFKGEGNLPLKEKEKKKLSNKLFFSA